jgi:hypothetical protein
MAGRYWAPPKKAPLPATTKVDERRRREEYDRTHPWHPMTEGVPVGTVCQLLLTAHGGDMVDSGKRRFFLHDDGRWYEIETQERLWQGVMNWRPVDPPVKLEPARREAIVKRANRDKFSGGRWIGDWS